mgnify:CR=1 FL=1
MSSPQMMRMLGLAAMAGGQRSPAWGMVLAGGAPTGCARARGAAVRGGAAWRMGMDRVRAAGGRVAGVEGCGREARASAHAAADGWRDRAGDWPCTLANAVDARWRWFRTIISAAMGLCMRTNVGVRTLRGAVQARQRVGRSYRPGI